MPNLVSNDKLLFTVWGKQGEQTFMNTQILHYTDDIGGPDDYVAFAQAYCNDAVAIGGLLDTIAPYLSDQFEYERVTLQHVYPTRLAPVFATAIAPGGIVSVPAPVNSALTLTKRSINATRWGVGSWHQGGLPISAIMAGGASWVGTTVANIQLALETWFLPSRVPTGMNGNVKPIIWTKQTPLRVTNVTSYQGQTSIRTMHRRTKGIGI